MRLTATTAVKRLTPALLAAVAVSVLGSGAVLAAKPSGGGSTGGGGKTVKDTTPPTISIASPTAGSTLSSSSATVDGSASDNVSVASVAVSVDGGAYATASGTTTWSDIVNSLSSGSHTITAKATDTSGNSSTASITVSVSTTTSGGTTATPPTSLITVPSYDGAVVSGPTTLTGSSSDSTYGVAKETWAIDGTVVATSSSAYGFSYTWDTTLATQGSHTITYTTWNTAGASSSASRPITVGAATIKRIGVILYNFQDQAPPTTPQQVADWTFGTTRSVAGYYQEQTWGRLLLGGQYNAAGDVFGFYTIPYSYANATTCDYADWEGSAKQQAQAAGVNLSGYDVVMMTAALPAGCGSGEGGGALARVPWNNPSTVDQWIAFAGHELGHSFGVEHHAGNDVCTDSSGHPVQISSTCTSSTYGDPYDIMGSGQVQDMSMYEKGQIGVLRAGDAVTVTSSGTYTLAPATESSTGVRSIRIPQSWDASGNPVDYYYVEFRQPTAYDVLPAGVVDYDGVQIRIAPDYSNVTGQSKLIDATPGSINQLGAYDDWDSRLPAGNYFQDSGIGLTVQTVSAGSTGATIKVTFGTPQCIRVNPSVNVSPPSQSGAPGQTMYYQVTVTNNDSPVCGPSTLTLNSSLPAGFSQSPASIAVSGMYPSGATAAYQVMVSSSSSTPAGTYTFTETVANGSSGAQGSATATEQVS